MKTTREVAAELGMWPAALRAHIAAGNVAPPARRVGMAFVWDDGEIASAREALSVPGRRKPRYTAGALCGERGNA